MILSGQFNEYPPANGWIFQTEDKVPTGALFLWKKGGICGIIVNKKKEG